MTIDEMIAAIEQRVCIREIWRCNAGWGMLTLSTHDVYDYQCAMERWFQSRLERRVDMSQVHPPEEPQAKVDNYYPSLEECVRAEYRRLCS